MTGKMPGICCTIEGILCRPPLSMDRAYKGDKTRECVEHCGLALVVLPQSNHLKLWAYAYKRRNEIEGLFRRVKAFRRVFSRFDKADVLVTAFVHVALIMEMIK